MMSGRWREAELRFNERRKREDEARRLIAQVPRLRSLKLEVEEQRGTAALVETRHVRVIVVERAPALFLLPCGDRDCRDGGHDVTEPILRGLQSDSERFEIEDTCIGNIRGAECGRMVRIVAKASYG
ncbi:MAG: hypothetical protein FWD17_02030 [Polyangiaceae bacterium]|nr:hypothetical protein [Polyangiaceae bacterium]